MARPRAFDMDLAVERAIGLFRRWGYHATPVPRLTALLGIGSGSLYAAFGSKDGLYARALKRYCDGLLADLDRDMRAGSDIRTALRHLLLTMVTADVADPERGCLLVSAATERAAHADTVEQVRAAMSVMESVLTEALRRAHARGELDDGLDPVEAARFLTTFIQGMRVMGQARADRAFLESAVAGALSVLDRGLAAVASQTTDPGSGDGFDNEGTGDDPERNRSPMTVINSPLPDEEREVAGSALQATLVDLLDLSLVAKQAHWNLYGPRFRSVHLQLDEVVATAREFADTVAERAAALGVSPDGRAATIAGTSGVPGFPAGWTKDADAVEALVRTFSAVIERVRERIESTGPADAVTQDLLIGLAAVLEKQSWMFQAENRR